MSINPNAYFNLAIRAYDEAANRLATQAAVDKEGGMTEAMVSLYYRCGWIAGYMVAVKGTEGDAWRKLRGAKGELTVDLFNRAEIVLKQSQPGTENPNKHGARTIAEQASFKAAVSAERAYKEPKPKKAKGARGPQAKPTPKVANDKGLSNNSTPLQVAEFIAADATQLLHIVKKLAKIAPPSVAAIVTKFHADIAAALDEVK